MAIEPFEYQKRTNIEEHNQIVDKLNEVIDAVNAVDPDPTEFETRIDALELSAINQQNAIEDIHTRDALQDTEISTIKGKVTVNTNNIEQVDNRVNEAYDTINEVQTGLNENMNELGGRVNELGDTVATVTGQVEQLETDTTNLDGRVTDLDGRLTTLAGNHTALEGRVDSIDSELGQLSTEVGDLETGKVDVAQGAENAGMFLAINDDGNVAPQLLNHPFKVEYNSVLQITSTEAYGDDLFAGVMAFQMTLSDQYDYIFKVELTGDDSDIDWYPTQEQGYFNIIFDRQPTNTVKVRIYGVVIG